MIIILLLYSIIGFGWALKYSALSAGAHTLITVYPFAKRI